MRSVSAQPSPSPRHWRKRQSAIVFSLLAITTSACGANSRIPVSATIGSQVPAHLGDHARASEEPTTSLGYRHPSTTVPVSKVPACSPAAIVSHWTLERRAAQVLVAPVDETDVAAAEPLVEEGIGGLILLGSAAPVSLPSDLDALRGEALDQLPPIVMTDEEGGEIQRMANLVGNLPWPRTMAQTMSPASVRSLAEQVGRAMRADGVTMDRARSACRRPQHRATALPSPKASCVLG
jgi:beta-N-acetylhexosaminidase